MDTNIQLMDSRRDRNSTLIASFIAVLVLLICRVVAAAPDRQVAVSDPASLIQKQCDAENADACTQIGEVGRKESLRAQRGTRASVPPPDWISTATHHRHPSPAPE